jgi:hypothetical protein
MAQYSGSFTLQQQMQAVAASTWPVITYPDPYFYDVSLLLNGDGTNGAQNNTFLDSSTNNFSITRNGNTTQGSFSPYGNLWSNYFPAGGNYALTTPASSNTSLGAGNFTIEGWVNTTSFGAYYNIIACKWDYPNKEWLFRFTSSSIDFYYSTDGLNDSGGFVTSTTIPLNTWCHIAVTRSGSNLYTFLNGVLLSTNSFTQTFYASSIVTAIGNFPNSGISDTGMRGYISNFRLVKGTALYTSSFTPSTTPLTAVSGTQLLTCQSNRYLDNSSNNFTVTPTSSNSVQRFSPFNPTAPYDTATIGGSGYFNGSGGVNVTSGASGKFPLGSAFTCQAWIYVTQTSGGFYQVFGVGGSSVDWNSSTGLTYVMGVDSGNVYWQWNNGGGTNSIGMACPSNQWVNVIVGYSGGTTRLWVNGVSTTSSGNGYNITSYDRVGVGCAQNGTSNPFYGYIEDLRFVAGTDIYGVGNTTITVPTAPLSAVSGTAILTSMTNAGIPDLAMQNNLQTVGSAQVSTSVKKYGTGSIFINGNTNYLCNYSQQAINATNFGTGDFTIETWIYFNDTSGIQGIIDDASNISAAGTQKWTINKDGSGRLCFGQHSVGNILTYAWNPSTGTWYHIAITRASGGLRMFVDGNIVASTSNTTNFASSGGVQIGIGASFNSLNGYLDDVRITNGYARYTANFTAPTAALPTY